MSDPAEQVMQPVCRAEDIPVGRAKRIEVCGKIIAVFHLEDGFYAIDDGCAHQGAPLSFGVIENGVVACPRHGARFDIRSGRVISLPATRGVHGYPVKVEGGRVYLGAEPLSKTKPDILRLEK